MTKVRFYNFREEGDYQCVTVTVFPPKGLFTRRKEPRVREAFRPVRDEHTLSYIYDAPQVPSWWWADNGNCVGYDVAYDIWKWKRLEKFKKATEGR